MSQPPQLMVDPSDALTNPEGKFMSKAVVPPVNPNWSLPAITEDIAKEALLEYASDKLCYGTSPARNLEVKELRHFNTYRYRLETFTESRVFEKQIKPYEGEKDDKGAKVPKSAWEIQVQRPVFFKDDVKKMPVVGTTSIKTCDHCNGKGTIKCEVCSGSGKVRCVACYGITRCDEVCTSCGDFGTQSCVCYDGTLVCNVCSGKKQLVSFTQLVVTWKTILYEYVDDHNTDFPTDKFKKVKGEKIFTDEQLLVPPIVNFHRQSINTTSQEALEYHQSELSSSPVLKLRQRQSIEWLPLTRVHYNWKEKEYTYYVYGIENKVYLENYPQKFHCTVM
ncbi:protein SSUH2 homolog isoform X2 [Xenopus laevis]|nr:protein SSUH2 homolog isoform X2 [Xenopus laevis]OCT85754.1 hypothetical protein XELAEV_18023925mg [Xenopus laevis]